MKFFPRGLSASCLVFLVALATNGHADDAPALTIRLIRPDEQGMRLIGLFRGARVADPAAALAAWKHATHGAGSLGKPVEALISIGNPAMVREFRGLDGAEARIWFPAGASRPIWQAVAPRDDGSFAALATALALTDGACEEPLGDAPVLRVGPPGAPLSAARDGRLALASNRDLLRAALERAKPKESPDDEPTGFLAHLEPSALRASPILNVRRLAAALDGVGCTFTDGRLALVDETLNLATTAHLKDQRFHPLPIEPAWLDVVPATHVVAAFSMALDTRASSLDATFALLDRVEKADPARAEVAPLRTRLNLIAAAARVRPEVDLWPALKGLTVAVLVDDAHNPAGSLLVLHATDAAAASTIARDVLPRLASAFLKSKTPDADADGIVPLGRVERRPLAVAMRGATVLLGWGDGVLASGLAALNEPAQSSGAALRADWGDTPPQRIGFIWPGRLRSLAVPGSPLARALDVTPPIRWLGRTNGDQARDVLQWANLRAAVARGLEALPLDPPPGR